MKSCFYFSWQFGTIRVLTERSKPSKLLSKNYNEEAAVQSRRGKNPSGVFLKGVLLMKNMFVFPNFRHDPNLIQETQPKNILSKKIQRIERCHFRPPTFRRKTAGKNSKFNFLALYIYQNSDAKNKTVDIIFQLGSKKKRAFH